MVAIVIVEQIKLKFLSRQFKFTGYSCLIGYYLYLKADLKNN